MPKVSKNIQKDDFYLIFFTRNTKTLTFSYVFLLQNTIDSNEKEVIKENYY